MQTELIFFKIPKILLWLLSHAVKLGMWNANFWHFLKKNRVSSFGYRKYRDWKEDELHFACIPFTPAIVRVGSSTSQISPDFCTWDDEGRLYSVHCTVTHCTLTYITLPTTKWTFLIGHSLEMFNHDYFPDFCQLFIPFSIGYLP
mgnify:CR=1 FL=1